ncbi:MAG: hypothetical protein MI750_11180 [Xanthomonadales bacterium]|nr:hypothetical protein [Xanthomonadales bacterium]
MYRLNFNSYRQPKLWQRIAAAVLAVLTIVLGFFLGLFVVLTVVGLLLIGAVVMGFRRFQAKRKTASPQSDGPIEGQYTVIKRRRS